MCSLGNRFNRHAQLSKQAMLARLVEALQRQQLHSDAPEAHYSLLSAIIHLSRKPLQDDYVPSAAALACLQAGATGTYDLLQCHSADRTAIQVMYAHLFWHGRGQTGIECHLEPAAHRNLTAGFVRHKVCLLSLLTVILAQAAPRRMLPS